jgi:CheY-like chemotaxis protein
VRVAHEPGLAPAGAMLALTGGALLPEAGGRWALRVPLHAERPSFLLVRQGELSLALPWPAVARLRLGDESVRAAATEPSLEPWTPLERTTGERPAALLARGLRRAWLHFDHIVWRASARPEPARVPGAVPGGHLAVHTEEGAHYWVVDVQEALAHVPELQTPPAQLRARAVPAAPGSVIPTPPPTAPVEPPVANEIEVPVVDAPPVETPAVEVPAAERVPEPVADPETVTPRPSVPPRLFVLGPEHVRAVARPRAPLRAAEVTVVAPREVAPPAVRTPAPVPPSAPPVTNVPIAEPPSNAGAEPAPVQPEEPGAPAAAPRRALVVDDSLVARIALARVLERAGWVVEYADRASEMWAALDTGAWGAVFVDVSLPDAAGRAHLRQLVARQLVTRVRFELVALTRDRSEEQLVADTGITRTLRKPFAPGAVEGLVRDLPGIVAGP